MNEQEARERIIAWAKEHFKGKTQPVVEVVGIHYDAEFEVWDAQLSVSTSADDPYVTFIEDSMHKHGVQVSHIEPKENEMETFQIGDKVEFTNEYGGKTQSVITRIVPKGEYDKDKEAYAIKGIYGAYVRTADKIRKIEK